ncbi:RDD family protein [Rickettsiales bacterium Ac37b]|nr:RDD family protein [Rickettsiales bacterium Ac37b]
MYNKQIKYAGLRGRLTASLIDMTIVLLLSMPVIKLLDFMLYGHNTPKVMMEEVIKDMEQHHDAANLSPMHQFFTDPKVYDFFITHHGLEKFIISNIIQLILFMIIVIICWIKYQATPGKMLLSFKIVDATTLDKPNKKQLFIRFLGYFLSFIPLLLGFTAIIFSKKKQGWHDKLANTLVIKK